MTPEVIYHIATREDWARAGDTYTCASLADEGFIHCSTSAQYAEVANRLFRGRDDLLLLLIDTARLSAPLKIENGYPHIYGPINTDAVFDTDAFRPNADGVFEPFVFGFDALDGFTLDDLKARVTEATAGYDRPWFVAGGWSLDLHIGRKTRPHADIEISVFRGDQAALYEHLRGWDLRLVAPKDVSRAWDGSPVQAEYHQIWTREVATDDDTWQAFAADPSHLDFMLEEGDGNNWIYRRDHRINQLRFGTSTPDGIRSVRPEIVLLYKSKATRWKDQRDFEAVLPHLDAEARTRLAAMLSQVMPDHPWIQALQ